MFRIYITRLVLPVVLVAATIALPFVWFPDVDPPAETPRAGVRAKARPKPSPFQGAMTLGFALILISVTAGGVMLYRITRSQTASWRRRFAPARKGRGAPPKVDGKPPGI